MSKYYDLEVLRCKHVTPKGWRRLKVGEDIKLGDMFNSKLNTMKYIGPNMNGFLLNNDLYSPTNMSTLNKVNKTNSCSYYRKSNKKRNKRHN